MKTIYLIITFIATVIAFMEYSISKLEATDKDTTYTCFLAIMFFLFYINSKIDENENKS